MEPPPSEENEKELHHLMRSFRSSMFKSRSSVADEIVEKCLELLRRDHPDNFVIDNENGLLSSSYPSKIFVPQRTGKTDSEKIDAAKLKNSMLRARAARCRARFPIPVIYYKQKYICRSSTLSGGPEIYGRTGFDMLFNSNDEKFDEPEETETKSGGNSDANDSAIFDSSTMFNYARKQDIELLKYLDVGLICDLMVERKKVKFGLNVTSSEKADKKLRYREFDIICLPYPGCEFFREVRNRGYQAAGIRYNWHQDFVDSALFIPDDKLQAGLDVDWTKYQKWDIVDLTSNYLKLILLFLKRSVKSILVHCISGWDRTPLFISLLRLSLWADGHIHQSLNAFEITYLTLAYDWYLFGHNLSDRLSKGEEILFFCFYFIKWIESNDFSIDKLCEDVELDGNVPNCENEKIDGGSGGDIDSDIFFNSDWSLNSNTSDQKSENLNLSNGNDNGFNSESPCKSNALVEINNELRNEKDFNQEETSVKSVLRSKPVEIPRVRRNLQNSDESSPSSFKSESWQIISYTESFTDIESFKVLHSVNSNNSQDSSSSPLTGSSNSSFVTITPEKCIGGNVSGCGFRIRGDDTNVGSSGGNCNIHGPVTLRKARLEQVRRYFFDAYSKVVFNNGYDVPAPTLSYLNNHFNETANDFQLYQQSVKASN